MANSNDFALIAMLGLLGLRVFEACGANIGDLGEVHSHRLSDVLDEFAAADNTQPST